MKKISIIFMVIIMAISFAACGKSGDKDKLKPENPTETIDREDDEVKDMDEEEQESTEQMENSGKEEKPVKQENPSKPSNNNTEDEEEETEEEETDMELPFIPM